MLTGSLKTFSFINLMQMCYNENTTGTIAFAKDSDSYASMGFTNGNLTHANFLERHGVDAVKQLTLLQDLDFTFSPDQMQSARNIETDINFLLLECSRYMDECVDYLHQLKTKFANKFKLKSAGFYQFHHSCFLFPDVYAVRYFEAFEDDEMLVVFHYDKIGAKIELQFFEKILTNDLLMFMNEMGFME